MQLTEATIEQSRRSNSDLRGGQPQLVQLVVDGRFFLDIKIGCRNVGFWLVIVVVGDEVFDRIVRKETLELVVELRGQGLVVGQNERGAIGCLNDFGHGKSLAGAGYAKQNLVLLTVENAARQGFDGSEPGRRPVCIRTRA